jgi:hypothetical protein
VVQDLCTNDMDRLPWFFKRYAQELPRLPLPRDLPPTTAPALAVLAGTAEVAPGRLDLAQLSRLLHLSAGIARISPGSGRSGPRRSICCRAPPGDLASRRQASGA